MSAIYPNLENQSILISGGGGGIGASIVEHFCRQKANVAFIDIDVQQAELTVAAVAEKTGVTPHFEVCDLRDIDATCKAVDELVEKTGSFSVLVNNAGHDQAHQLEKVTPEYWDDRVAVNLKHQYFLIQKLASNMRKNQGGSIINMGSISWMMGAEGVSAYTTLKSAVMGLTKSMARELGHDGIRVNSIAPGWVLTDKQLEKAKQHPEKLDSYLSRQCIKQSLEPADIAKLCLWLASEESIRLTGQTIICDGGVI